MSEIYNIDYDEIVIFEERITRFTVKFINKNNEFDFAHLHDTGRMKELLVKGNKILIKKVDKKERKTKWDVVAVEVEENNFKELVLINSSYHRYIAENILKNEKISPFGKLINIKLEIKYGKSRIDFYIEVENKNKKIDKIYIETKGCTLVENKIAKFPGAPSNRATKHLNELQEIKKEGYRSAVLLLIFRKAEKFQPEHNIDPLFSKTFYEVMENGVEIYPLLLKYENKKIEYVKKIEIEKFKIKNDKINKVQ